MKKQQKDKKVKKDRREKLRYIREVSAEQRGRILLSSHRHSGRGLCPSLYLCNQTGDRHRYRNNRRQPDAYRRSHRCPADCPITVRSC